MDSPVIVPEDIEPRLRQAGAYPTPQRLAIARFLFSKKQHVTADQVHREVSTSAGGVSVATVYNTLGLFADKGLVRQVFVDASRTFYDSNTAPHHHFYNVDSGDLIDMKERLVPFFVESDLPANTAIQDVDIVIRVRSTSTPLY